MNAASEVKHTTALTTEQCQQLVYSLQPTTAVFDYDGTLWPGDAGSGFMQWSIQTGLLSSEKARWLLNRHASYHRGDVDEITICGEMVQVYGGLSEEKVRASARDYFKAEVEPHLFPAMIELVHELKLRDTEIWAVSSTNNWVIEAGVEALGIAPDRVLAACIATDAEFLTDMLLDVPSDEGKAASLHRAGLPAPDVVFGNSIHDAAMLELARQPIAINPTPALRVYAEERNWPVYYPVSLTYGSR